jgi:hypothetical protein
LLLSGQLFSAHPVLRSFYFFICPAFLGHPCSMLAWFLAVVLLLSWAHCVLHSAIFHRQLSSTRVLLPLCYLLLLSLHSLLVALWPLPSVLLPVLDKQPPLTIRRLW